MAIPLTLRIFRGTELVATKEFHRDIIKIGRLSSAHLCLEDDKVSRIHAVVEVAGDGSLSIIDMGSVEGTFVNGKRVNKGTLQSGDEISVGNTRIKLEVGASAAVSAAPTMDPPGEEPTAVVADPGPGLPEQAPAAGFAQLPAPAIAPAVLAPAVVAAPPAAVELPAPLPPAAPAAPAPVQAAPVQAAPVQAAPVQAAPAPYSPPFAPAAAGPYSPGVTEEHAHAVGRGGYESALSHWPVQEGPPPRPTPLSRDASTKALALEVRLYWGNQQLAAGIFDKEPLVTVGPGKASTFQFDGSFLQADAFPLLRQENGDWYLTFNDRMDGEIDRGGQVMRLQEAKGRSAGGGHGSEVKLSADCAAWVDLGNIRADVCFRPKPRVALAPLADRLDYQFLNLLLFVLFFNAAAVVAFQNYAFDTDLLADDLFANQARFTKLILKPPEKKKNPLLEKLKSLDGPKDPGEMAAKAKMDEGQMGKKTAEVKKTRSAPKAIDPNDKEQVKNKGLLAMLGKSQNAGLSTIFGTSGLGGDLKGAIGGITGTQVGDAHGFGGLGLKGTGVGGGGVGNTIGVGDIGTKGRGGGLGGYGSGVGGLGRKGSADVSIDASSAIVMGSLDKELIRKVIHAHRSQIRYCYESELVRNPKLGGKIAVKFVITASGSVSSATTAQTTMNNSTVESCIAARVKSWEFPKPKGGGVVVVTYPFIFKQSGE